MVIDVAMRKELEKVKVITQSGKEEWGHLPKTNRYFTHFKEKHRLVLVELDFIDIYRGGCLKPDEVVVYNQYLMRIETKIDAREEPMDFIKLLNRKDQTPKGRKYRVYKDNEMVYIGVSSSEAHDRVHYYLHQRKIGTDRFMVIKHIDPSGNITRYYPSPVIRDKMLAKIEEESSEVWEKRQTWAISEYEAEQALAVLKAEYDHISNFRI